MAYSFIAKAEHKIYTKIKRKRLKNNNPSIIANNCNGGIISHDLGLPFCSPTVNIGIWPEDYLKFLKNLEHYLNYPIQKTDKTKDGGKFIICDDIEILLTHYKNYDEACENWERRKKRFNPDNMFVVFCDKMGCTYDIIKEFDELPIKNKVIFTHKPYPEFKSAYYIKGFENDGEVGILSDWKPGFWQRRWLDGFDYVKFLNGDGIE